MGRFEVSCSEMFVLYWRIGNKQLLDLTVIKIKTKQKTFKVLTSQ